MKLVAKFERENDGYPVIRWEALMLALAVSQWRNLAGKFGIPAAQQTYMETAFDHADMDLALKFGKPVKGTSRW